MCNLQDGLFRHADLSRDGVVEWDGDIVVHAIGPGGVAGPGNHGPVVVDVQAGVVVRCAAREHREQQMVGALVPAAAETH